jgi:hypothetical protein
MKFLFWNIIGFGKVARRRKIREYIMDKGLDGIGIQETM